MSALHRLRLKLAWRLLLLSMRVDRRAFDFVIDHERRHMEMARIWASRGDK